MVLVGTQMRAKWPHSSIPTMTIRALFEKSFVGICEQKIGMLEIFKPVLLGIRRHAIGLSQEKEPEWTITGL